MVGSVLRIAAAALALTALLAVGQLQAQEAAFKQMKLTEAQIENYLKAQGELNKQFEKIEQAGEQPDKTLVQGLEAIAKKYGFSSYDELDAIMSNISFEFIRTSTKLSFTNFKCSRVSAPGVNKDAARKSMQII